MSIEQAVLEKLRELPPDAQRKVLDFAQTLRGDLGASSHPLKSLYGLWADLGITLGDGEIDQMRREIWGQFPREIEP